MRGLTCSRILRYKIGDSFFYLALSEVQELLAEDIQKVDAESGKIEERLSNVKDEIQELKIALYARFGKSINLET